MTIGINLKANILRGQKNYDDKSGSYSIKDLPGMPKKLVTHFKALNKRNTN